MLARVGPDYWPGSGPITSEDYYYRNARARGPENRAHGPKNLNSNSNRVRLGRARPITVTMCLFATYPPQRATGRMVFVPSWPNSGSRLRCSRDADAGENGSRTGKPGSGVPGTGICPGPGGMHRTQVIREIRGAGSSLLLHTHGTGHGDVCAACRKAASPLVHRRTCDIATATVNLDGSTILAPAR